MFKRIKLLSCILSVLFILSACQGSSNSSSTSNYSTDYEVLEAYASNLKDSDGKVVTPFNTSVTFRAFCEKDYKELYPLFNERIIALHKQFDRHHNYKDAEGNVINNLKVINDSYGTGETIEVSSEMIGLLEQSIEMSVLTKGYFNPTLGELTDIWTYSTNEEGIKSQRFSPYCFEDEDPSSNEIEEGMSSIVPYDQLENIIEINKENKTVKFNKYNNIEKVTISLGAIAKGYAIELVKKELEVFNVPVSISGGSSSSYTLGKNPNPERDYWIVGIAAPYKTGFNVNAMLSVNFHQTYTLSVSGDYESSYYVMDEDKKIIRHHILNPFTGYPENHMRVLSLWSNTNSGVLDALSTALFNMSSSETILETIYSVEDYYKMDIEVLYEVEKDASKKKIDLYMTKDYKAIVNQYNTAYFNGVYTIDE